MNDLIGKIALVTGGTSGIGEAIVKRYAKAGATVIIGGRNENKGLLLSQEIIADGGKAEFLKLDITDDASINKAYGLVKEKYHKLNVLVNNAGIYPLTPSMEDMTRIFANKVFDTNLSGTIMTTKAFIALIRVNRGNILNTASVAGLEAYTAGGAYAYSASKAGVIKFTQLLAKKYGSEIRANCICPGVIKTPIFKCFDESRYVKNIPMRRTGTPDDVAKVANFLVSDDAGYVNGCVVAVDGGQSL